jgi:hypothetical protein
LKSKPKIPSCILMINIYFWKCAKTLTFFLYRPHHFEPGRIHV